MVERGCGLVDGRRRRCPLDVRWQVVGLRVDEVDLCVLRVSPVLHDASRYCGDVCSADDADARGSSYRASVACGELLVSSQRDDGDDRSLRGGDFGLAFVPVCEAVPSSDVELIGA